MGRLYCILCSAFLLFTGIPSLAIAYDFLPPDSKGRNPIWENRSARINLGLDDANPVAPQLPPPIGGPWNPVAQSVLNRWAGVIGSQFTFNPDVIVRNPCDAKGQNENCVGWADLSGGNVVCGMVMPPGTLGITIGKGNLDTGFFQSANILLNTARNLILL